MATIKNCTDIPQSRKLAKILPIESADMYWWATNSRYYIEAMDDGDFNEAEGHIRAWSLAALLSVIPNYKLSSEHNYHTCIAETSFGEETVGWFDNPVDACVVMIEKLNELKML